MGDMIVTAPSAMKSADDTRLAKCAYQLDVVEGAAQRIALELDWVARQDVPDQPLASMSGPCFHTSLMRTIQLTNEAVGVISDAVQARQPAFAGGWYVHGGQMVISSQGRGQMSFTSPCGPSDTQSCRDVTHFRYDKAQGGQQLLATVTKTEFLTGQGIDLARMGEYSTHLNEGDSFELRFAAPHLLVTRYSSAGPEGNPYWCRTGVAGEHTVKCGA